MTLVSVITPYYKKRNYFKKYFTSIQKQTYSKLEIIIIYDDKDDEELKFIREIIKFDKRFKIIVNKNRLGAGKSRNKGILKAKGKYIAFLDADDFWRKNKIELQLKFMVKNNLKISHTSYQILKKKHKFKKVMKAETFKDYKKLLLSCNIGLSTVILKKKILSKNLKFPKLRTKEDMVLWIKLSKKNELIGYKKILSSWRKLDDSLSSNSFQKIKDGFNLYYEYLGFNVFKSVYFLFLLSINFVKKNI